jgi:hypothetical protein
MNRYSRAAVGGALLAFLAGCTAISETAGGASSSAVPRIGSATARTSAVSLGQKYVYVDGAAVFLSEITNTRLGAYPPAGSKGEPYTILTVNVRNGTPNELAVVLNGELRYGPDRAPAYSMTLSKPTSTQHIAPGATSRPHDIGFLLPAKARGDVVFRVTIDGGHDAAVFAGSVTHNR